MIVDLELVNAFVYFGLGGSMCQDNDLLVLFFLFFQGEMVH